MTKAMTERNAVNTIRTAFWMPQSLPEGSNFRFEKDSRATCGELGDVAGPQPKTKPRTGWQNDSLSD